MKKHVLALAFLAFAAVGAQAQSTGSSYRTALGFKGYFGNGSMGGVGVKHFLNGSNALEANVLFRNSFFALEGMYLYHGNITGAPGLKWYVGPGVQLGSVGGGGNSDVYFAGKGSLGLDYKFRGAPIAIAADVNPQVRFTQGTDFDFYGGFAFRFTL